MHIGRRKPWKTTWPLMPQLGLRCIYVNIYISPCRPLPSTIVTKHTAIVCFSTIHSQLNIVTIQCHDQILNNHTIWPIMHLPNIQQWKIPKQAQHKQKQSASKLNIHLEKVSQYETRPIAISRVLRAFSDRMTDRPTVQQTNQQSGL